MAIVAGGHVDHDRFGTALRFVTDDEPGINRVRRGNGFSYHYPDGRLISERWGIPRR